jgi:hypothetical protein
MTGLKHDEVLSGLQFVVPWVKFDLSIAEAGGSDGGNAGVFTVAPSLFVVKTLSDRARLGFSVAGLLGGGVDYAVGATALYAGDAKVDQTSQGVRAKGEFDTNWIFFLGGTLRYVF